MKKKSLWRVYRACLGKENMFSLKAKAAKQDRLKKKIKICKTNYS